MDLKEAYRILLSDKNYSGKKIGKVCDFGNFYTFEILNVGYDNCVMLDKKTKKITVFNPLTMDKDIFKNMKILKQ